MRKIALLSILTLASLPLMAEVLPCDVLKARVDAKLQAKGVQVYTLEIVPMQPADVASGVPANKTSKGKEVGTCGGGTHRLIYTRGN